MASSLTAASDPLTNRISPPSLWVLDSDPYRPVFVGFYLSCWKIEKMERHMMEKLNQTTVNEKKSLVWLLFLVEGTLESTGKQFSCNQSFLTTSQMIPPSNNISRSYSAASSSTTTAAVAESTPDPYKAFKNAFGDKRASCEACFRKKKKTLIMGDTKLKSHYGKAHLELRIKCPTFQNKFSSRKEVKEHRDQYY